MMLHPYASIDVVWRLRNAPQIEDQGTAVATTFGQPGDFARDMGRAIGMPEAPTNILAAQFESRLAMQEVTGGMIADGSAGDEVSIKKPAWTF